MRNVAMLAGLLVLSAVTSVGAVAQDAGQRAVDKEELQRLYTDYLGEEGYKWEIDTDGDVRFKREGKVYFIQVSDKDPEFFTVVLPNIWPIENEKERLQVLVAADASNAKSKVSKVYTMGDNVWVSIELFVERPEQFKAVFKRALSALDNGVANFAFKMREQRE